MITRFIRQRKWLLLSVSLILFILLALLAWKGWHVYQLAEALRQDMRTIHHLTTDTPDSETLTALDEHLTSAHIHARALRAEAEPLLPFTVLFSWLPRYGDDLAAAEPLLDLAVSASAAADHTVSALVPVVQVTDMANPMGLTSLQMDTLAAARPHLEQARANNARAAQALADVPQETLSPWIRERLQRVELLLPLLDAGIDTAIAADDLRQTFEPLLEADLTSAAILAHVHDARPYIIETQESLTQALASWRQVPPQVVPASLANRQQDAIALMTTARDGLDLALMLPDLAGADEPDTYVFIAQNPDELRATGGFISAVGELTLDEGRITNFSIDHTDNITSSLSLYPEPPQQLSRYMDIYYWVFRDANWSPDFPTAVRDMLPLYELERGHRPDNMIAFTPTTLHYVLEALGPLHVEGSADPVSAETLEQYIRTQYNRSEQRDIHRKAFLEPFLEAIIERLQSNLSPHERLEVARAILRALNERHLLIASTDDEVAALLAQNEWDGAVQPGTQDFVMIVDSNVGYSKANTYIQQAILYDIDLRTPDTPTATLTIRHTHTLNRSEPCWHWSSPVAGTSSELTAYQNYTDRCYWDYLRVLVPDGSRLLGIETQPVPEEWLLSHLDTGTVHQQRGVRDTTMFSTFLIVPMGETRETVLHYQLPADVITYDEQGHGYYQLRVQKQAGREALPFTVRLHLPDTRRLISAAPESSDITKHMITWETDLAQDRLFTVTSTTTP
jgi:hypothetical protein